MGGGGIHGRRPGHRTTLRAVSERRPGTRWQRLFERHWKPFRRWYLSEGDAARPSYLECRRQLDAHMPELVRTYERLCELAGGSDVAARALSLYRPPAYVHGCSQSVWPGERPFLVRNYDYSPYLFEGSILRSAWCGKQVLAMLDCLWGVVDGINEDGLVVSLTFGGRQVVGDGFGMPLILRYILEVCETTSQAVQVLRRVPSHMSYNITLLDASGHFTTVFVAPDRQAVVRQIPVTTNHQGRVEWERHARISATLERERFLNQLLADLDEQPDDFIDAFLQPPLYNTDYDRGFGTLYCAVYWPDKRAARYRWPGLDWDLAIDDFEEGTHHVTLAHPPRGWEAAHGY